MHTFITLYNEAPIFSLRELFPKEKYESMGMAGHALSSRVVEKELIKRIKDFLTPTTNDNYITRANLASIKEAYYYIDKLNGTYQLKKYFVALHELDSILGPTIENFEPLTNSNKWKEALKYLKCYIDENGVPNDDMLSSGMEKQSCRIKAIKRLQKKGVKYKINENNELELSNLYCAVTEIATKMERIGGVRFINECLSEIAFDDNKGRLMFPKQGNPIDLRKVKPEIPYGYLFNLAFRMTSSKGSDTSLTKYFDALIQDACDLCVALYPVQNYAGWMEVLDKEPFDIFRKWSVYDSLIDVQQASQKFCQDMMDFLIDKIINDNRRFERSYSLVDFQNLIRELCARTSKKQFVRVPQNEIMSISSEDIRKAILHDITNTIVNPNYENPLDFHKTNYSDKPAIMLRNGDILLYPSSIGAMGWYEVMMSLLRERDEIVTKELEKQVTQSGSKKDKYIRIDNFIGIQLEEYIKQKLSSKGIDTKCGKYAVNGINGECDIVVENTEKVLLFEVKKKNMTRKSRCGYLYQIILDFAGSVLNSQEQAHRTETLVRKNNQITLNDCGTTTTLDYNNRGFEKITLTLNDFGPLNERLIQQQVLNSFYKYGFGIYEDEIRKFEEDEERANQVVKKYKALEKKQNSLRTYIQNLAQFDKSRKYVPFFDSWFFNIEQLCYLIDLSKDTDDFIRKFSKLKYITFFTKDFWCELELKLGM